MKRQEHKTYLIASPKDSQWGMTVTSVGTQTIDSGAEYPPKDHPSRYLFTAYGGRILDEYQLIYLAEGEGWFTSESLGRRMVRVKQGDMFLLFPGEWHTYYPERETGWTEYWIGFNGSAPDRWLGAEFISKAAPVFNVGPGAPVREHYERAVEIASDQESGYQQMLSSLAELILSSAVYYSRNNSWGGDTERLIREARARIAAEISTITPEALAGRLGIGYSRFRKMFKGYTGIAPGAYIHEMKIARAKMLLTNTDSQVQEIAWSLGFENADYFVTTFRKATGTRPSEYRLSTRIQEK